MGQILGNKEIETLCYRPNLQNGYVEILLI